MIAKGLAAKKAEKLLKQHGENKLKAKKAVSWVKVLLDQFKSPLIYILVMASGVTLALGDLIDAGVIGAAVVLNTILGFYQEMKAEKSLEALSSMLSPKAKVIRDGKRELIDASLIVPGDVCVLEIGERVPADGVVIESDSLSVSEAMLTGESVPVEKGVIQPLNNKKQVESNSKSMVFMGTLVSSGIGKMKVVKTGQETEMGKIADKLTETKEEKTPLQKQIGKFSKKLAIMVGVISLVILVVGLMAGDAFVEIFTTAVAVAVSAIPEGLAVSLTVILAIGMQRIFKKKALVRKLMAAETLGSVTVICSDKTGTLTEGKMRVVLSKSFLERGGYELALRDRSDAVSELEVRNQVTLQMMAMLCNDMRDPLEIGMMEWAQHPGDIRPLNSAKNKKGKGYSPLTAIGRDIEALVEQYPRIDSIPFDPRTKYIATLHEDKSRSRSVNRGSGGKNLLLVSGAPEIMVERSYLSKKDKEKMLEKFREEGRKGYRLVGFSYKEVGKSEVADKDVSDLKFVGYLAFEDPVRENVKQALKEARGAGIKVKVITGDYLETAKAVLNELELDCEVSMEGYELEKISDEELQKKIGEVTLFARTNPEQKLRIVQALQNNNEVVAMTGDGVNDAPAVRQADIGIVVNEASAVARETADMILLDSNFATIVGAVEEGRGIFVNLKKIILYLLSDAFAEVILVLGSMVLGLPLPITAAQILWINLVDDGLPDFALTLEPKPSDLMKQKPRGHERQLMDGEVKLLIGLISSVSGFLALGLFYVYHKTTGDLMLARTVAFTTLAISTLLYVFSCKSLKKPIWRENIFDNVWLIGAVMIGFSFQLMALYLPSLQRVLKTVALGVREWGVVFVVSMVVIIMIEIVKAIYSARYSQLESIKVRP